MKLFLRDTNLAVCQALTEAFRDLPDVTVQHGDIFQTPVGAVVSPANSFGWMDGGIDLVYVQRMGLEVQRRVQKEIGGLLFGELLVGDSRAVATGWPNAPVVIVAPTMRVPGPTTTEAVFLAMRAAMFRAQFFDTVACPGLGTWSGRVPPIEAARAMYKGYCDGLATKTPVAA
jgi:O-acetyl-ADP-ribose deacetylase (regulator of RNase III)